MKSRDTMDCWMITGCCAVILLLQMATQFGAYLHWESSAFLLNYTDGRSFFAQILDVQKNDWGLYQARELSYVLDWLDANFIWWSFGCGWFHFYSLSAFILVLMIVWIQQWLLRCELKIHSPVAGLLSLWFVLVECVGSNLFFRSAKYLTGFGIALVFLFTVRCVRHGADKRNIVGLAFGLLLMVLSDRQGMFFAVIYTVTVALLLLIHYSRLRAAVIAGSLVCLFGVLYNLYLAPFLILSVNGYGPSFEYQKLSGWAFQPLWDGVVYLVSNLGFMVGGFASGALWIGIVMVVILLLWTRRAALSVRLIGAAALGSIALCAGLMQLRHPVLLDTEIIFGSYFFPSSVILFFCLILNGKQWKTYYLILIVAAHLTAYVNKGDFNPEIPSQKIYQQRLGELRQYLRQPELDVSSGTMPYRLKLLVQKYRDRLDKQ